MVQKTSSFAIDLFDFLMSKSVNKYFKSHQRSTKNRVWSRPGGPLGGDLGTILVPGWPKAQKRDKKTANPQFAKPTLGQAFRGLVLYCFWVACFSDFKWFWVPFECSGFTLRALGLGGNSGKCCNGCQFQRFPLPDRTFLQVLVVGAFR